MPKLTIRYTDYFPDVMRRLREDGLLLATADASGKPNVMTIGWATIGSIWARPIMIVLVRPSRHSYSRLEEVPDFTVNVPPHELAEAVAYCGKASGRDRDKFADSGLRVAASRHVRAPIIEQCVIHYECRTIHKNQVVPDALAKAVVRDCYLSGDFHTLYYGQILGVLADEDARERLKG